MNKEIFKVNRERFYNPFSVLSHSNRVILENAKKQQSKCYEYIASIILSAFSFEGFLNLIGNRLFLCWKEIERTWSYSKKLECILKNIGFKANYGVRPYQTIGKLFKFRNELAHPKPQNLKDENKIEKGDEEEIRRKQPQMEWEKNCTRDFATMSYEDVNQIAKEIWEKAGFDLSDMYSRGHSYTKSRLSETKDDSSP